MYCISKNNKVPEIPANPVPQAKPEAAIGSKPLRNPNIVVEPIVWLRPINGIPIKQNINLSNSKEEITKRSPNIDFPVINKILVVC